MPDLDAITADDESSLITRAEAKRMIRMAVNEAMLRISRAPRPFKVFGLKASEEYASRVASHMGIIPTPHDEKEFGDGELYCKPDGGKKGNVRGHNVFVIQSLYTDDQETVSDKFMKLCIMCGALRDASAHEVTVIVPHLGWQRQDRKTESRAPITTKYVAQILESLGVDRVLMIDAHNLSAEQNAFRIPIDNLETKNLHAKWCAEALVREKAKKVRVLTPDAGGLGRATRFRNALVHILGTEYDDDIQLVIFDKVREKGVVTGGRIIGDVEDADVIAYDDMISTGATMRKALRAVKASNGRVFAVCAAHGLFCGEANSVFADFDSAIVVADTVEPFRLNDANKAKIRMIDTSQMVADAIVRIHSGTGSISELLDLDS